jgi:transposase
MRMQRTRLMTLSARDREELEAVGQRPGVPHGHARRARVILLSAEGVLARDIAVRLRLSAGQVSRIRKRFRAGGVHALADRPRAGRKDHAVPLEKVAVILALVRSTPPFGRTRWSTRLIGREVGLSSATVAKVLRIHRSSPAIVLPPRERPSEDGGAAAPSS